MSFAIGDVVYVYRPVTSKTHPLTGKVGCVKAVKTGGDEAESIGVEFNEDIGGHDLNGHCLKPFGYWMGAKDIKKMEPLTTLLQKQWEKEWEPRLIKKKKEQTDSVIILEE